MRLTGGRVRKAMLRELTRKGDGDKTVFVFLGVDVTLPS